MKSDQRKKAYQKAVEDSFDQGENPGDGSEVMSFDRVNDWVGFGGGVPGLRDPGVSHDWSNGLRDQRGAPPGFSDGLRNQQVTLHYTSGRYRERIAHFRQQAEQQMSTFEANQARAAQMQAIALGYNPGQDFMNGAPELPQVDFSEVLPTKTPTAPPLP